MSLALQQGVDEEMQTRLSDEVPGYCVGSYTQRSGSMAFRDPLALSSDLAVLGHCSPGPSGLQMPYIDTLVSLSNYVRNLPVRTKIRGCRVQDLARHGVSLFMGENLSCHGHNEMGE